ncbi:MAG: penicillin-binding protein 1A [Betaproteobacteria bacterium]|jgi:penicillin-binding protein 1A|nr:penicillin-binding protein 1A [Betaproteobacteria bacterium]MBK7742919.1 penicillin-binding protein 1A [Betaproteobacteria bacterium]MBK8688101.1 penicillin-binding protein 1A [Betaproteobacteria bacterium]MBL0290862.1 penicillin-binding protein 1A [Betaproteobacteria bacterium]
MLKRWLLYVGSVLLGLAVVGGLLGGFVLVLLYPTLPSLETLTDYQPKIPLRVVTVEGEPLGEFGEERRAVVSIAEVPPVMKQAILAAEDERFYSHGGVDYISVFRAAATNLASGTQQGAGTITMQVARNFFLTREKTVTRKLREVLLAWKIEANLSKDEILQLYLNQIFLGQRAYGFAAAAQIYFGKPLKDVSPAEAAMLAGLPKAPSAFNPITNPKRAKTRQLYVLRRMHDLRFLTDVQYKEAQIAPLAVRQGLRETMPTHGEFVAEMARQVVFEAYGEDAYTRGLTVYTTIRKADQEAAYAALRRGVLDYDRRHGYRGPESLVNLPETPAELEAALEKAFQEAVDSDGLLPAVVLAASPTEVEAVLSDGESVKVTGDGLRFVARALGDKAAPATRLRRGALIRLARDDKSRWTITQLPTAEAAFVSMRPRDGAIVSLVGGFDFERNKFNHVTQAQRQPGSSFKPFIYSAALEKGFTPATVVNDAPFYVPADKAGGEDWEPKNYDAKFEGPMRVRTALAKSKNLVTVRVLQAIGPQYAQDYIARFGFDPKLHPPFLTMGLGAGSVTPMQMVAAYAILANGGHRVTPFLIAKVVDGKGNVLSEATPEVAGENAERALDPRNAFLMTSLLKDVIAHGTGARALSLGRRDLAGKTGTTNENVDAWFCGYNAALVGVAWIGYDQPKSLGTNETGGVAALPIWIGYMQKALKGTPETTLPVPDGIVAVRINADTGLRDESGTISEYFLAEFPPRSRDDSLTHPATPGQPGRDIREQLF